MRHIFIVNPMAGKNNIERLTKHIEEVFRERDYEIVLTNGPKHATHLARQYARNCKDVCIYACGGDGTLNEVLNGMYEYENASLGIIPIGTGNDFIKVFGDMFKKEDFLCIKDYKEGYFMPCDILQVGDSVCINTASVGLDVAVADNVNKFKKLPLLKGSTPYYFGLLNSMVSGLHQSFQLVADGKVLPKRDYTFVVACNGKYYGGGYNPCPDAEVNDGLIDVCLIHKVTRRQIVRLSGKYKKGTHTDEKYKDIVTMLRCKRLQILAEKKVHLNMDGEILETKDPEIRILEKRIRLYLPGKENK